MSRIKRVLVCGDRFWDNTYIIMDVLEATMPMVVIEGGAKGADTIAKECANKLDIVVIEYPAKWYKYGRAAGPIRNREMIKLGKPEIVLAFHNCIAQSKGTKHMIWLANKEKIPVHLYGDNGSVQYNYIIV